MISETTFDPILGVNNVTLISFDIVEKVNIDLVPQARLDLSVPENITHYKISANGNIWVLFSNNTVNVYTRLKFMGKEQDKYFYPENLK